MHSDTLAKSKKSISLMYTCIHSTRRRKYSNNWVNSPINSTIRFPHFQYIVFGLFVAYYNLNAEKGNVSPLFTHIIIISRSTHLLLLLVLMLFWITLFLECNVFYRFKYTFITQSPFWLLLLFITCLLMARWSTRFFFKKKCSVVHHHKP